MINITETNYDKIEALINFMKSEGIKYQTEGNKPKEKDIDPLFKKFPLWHTSDVYHRRLAFARFYFNGKKDAQYWNVVRHCGSHIKAEELYLQAEQNNRKDLVNHLKNILNESE